MSVDKETGHFDVAEFSNRVVSSLDAMNSHFEIMGGVLAELKKGQEKSIKREVTRIVPGNTRSFNFQVMSIYVDNSASAQPITLVDEHGVSYTVQANTQSYVHPLGSRHFDIVGTNACPAQFLDTFINA